MTGTQEIAERVAKIVGALTGLVLWLIWGYLIISTSFVREPWGFWLYLGPLPLFVGACYYYFNRKYWTVPKQQQQLAFLEGGVLGFFLWSVAIVFLPEIGTVNAIFPNLAGWLVMLVIMVYFGKRVRRSFTNPEFP